MSCNSYFSGEDDDDAVYGNTYSGSIGDLIWRDADEDGLQDLNEIGVPNVPIQLIRCGDGQIIQTGMSKTDGKYLFMGINP